MYRKALDHFKERDPRLHELALRFELEDLEQSEDLFRDIVWTIIGQQLSGKAADSIFARFELLFPGKLITPEAILSLDEGPMRASGLSGAKVRAVRDLAEKARLNEVNLEALPRLSDEEVIRELTKVKGIGPWTAEMVMMFSLGRTDVFSLGDLVLRKEMMALYGWKKLPSDKKVREALSKWSPYRTYAARILWKAGDDRKKGTMRKGYK